MFARELIRVIHISLVALGFFSSVIPAQAFSSEPKLFDGFWKNTGDAFSGGNLVLHAAGFASTALLIRAGTDGQVYGHFRQSPNLAAWPGAVIGSGLGALVAGGWLYSSGRRNQDSDAVGAAFVIAQTSALTLGYVALLKVTTGRAHPTNTWHLTPQEQSQEFQFGFLRNGVTAYGWPSGHVSHTVAVTSALASYYPDKAWLKWLGAGLTGYMLYTVVAHDSGQMHWFSDGVAGAFMGYAIGSTVGRNFRAQMGEAPQEPSSSTTWFPMIAPGTIGLTAGLLF